RRLVQLPEDKRIDVLYALLDVRRQCASSDDPLPTEDLCELVKADQSESARLHTYAAMTFAAARGKTAEVVTTLLRGGDRRLPVYICAEEVSHRGTYSELLDAASNVKLRRHRAGLYIGVADGLLVRLGLRQSSWLDAYRLAESE